MKRDSFIICIYLVFAVLMSSCAKYELQIQENSPVYSNNIIFGGKTTDYIVVTRSAEKPAKAVKLTEKTFTSQSSDITLPLTIKVEQGINKLASIDYKTKATALDSADYKTLDAWAIYTKDGESNLYFRAPFAINEINGIFYPSNGETYPWKREGGNFDFTTVSPAGTAMTAVYDETNTSIESFEYTVNPLPENQYDIIIAQKNNVADDYEEAVPLSFKHIMAAVNVKVGTDIPGGIIKSIKFKGVYNKGFYHPDEHNWVGLTINNGGEFSVPIEEGGFNVTANSSTEAGPQINAPEATFMMIPQQLYTGAEIEVVFYDNTAGKDITLRASIQGDVWEINTTINYLININPEYNLSIVPLDKVLDSHYIITKVELSSEYPIWQLYATASDNADVTIQPEAEVNPMAKKGFWTDKYASRDGNGNYYLRQDAASARGTDNCSGSRMDGQIIYVFIPENVTNDTRTITLTLIGTNGTDEGTAYKSLELKQEPVKWLQDPYKSGDTDTYWGCELLLEGGQVPWGFCWDGIVEEYITTQGNQQQVPPGQLKHIEQKLIANGFDVQQMYDPDFYIHLIQKKNNNQGWLLQIDYSHIGNIEIAGDPLKGDINTKELYNFDGISTLASLKDFIANQDNIVYTATSGEANITNTLDFAAMYAIKRNRFHLYDGGDGLYIPYIDISKDLNWYLPAKGQFPYFNNLNWGQSFSFNDMFWTSTAYLTDTETDNAHAYAYINGTETLSHRKTPLLTFALRRFTIQGEVDVPAGDNLIKPGGDNGAPGGSGGTGGDNSGGDISGGTN